MEENKYTCPICMGSKEVFTGSKYEECNTCDKEGLVNMDIIQQYEGSDDLI